MSRLTHTQQIIRALRDKVPATKGATTTEGAAEAGRHEAAHGVGGKARPPERPSESSFDPDPMRFDRLHDRFGLDMWPD
jgi:hypothetical protein